MLKQNESGMILVDEAAIAITDKLMERQPITSG